FTPNDLFYITTKNAVSDPVVDPRQWRLVLYGEVAKPVQLDLPLLYQLPAVEVVKTLECISNRVARCGEAPFGCDAIGNARWKGVVKTMARIDAPAEGQTLPPGEHRIAGVAYAGSRGISRVEYSADGGRTWREATPVEPPAGPDSWLRWQGTFLFDGARPLDLAARAVDGAG